MFRAGYSAQVQHSGKRANREGILTSRPRVAGITFCNVSAFLARLRHGAAANVARLFYLVPPVTALEAYLLFGETLDAWALIGMALICLGVMLARRK